MGALWENKLFRNHGSVLVRVGLNQPFYTFDDAVHAGGHRRGGGLRTTENTFHIRSMLGITRHLLHLVSLNARGRKRVVMAGWAGKELRGQAIFFIDEGFLVFVVDQCNRDFLRQELVTNLKRRGLPFIIHCSRPSRGHRSRTRGFDRAFLCWGDFFPLQGRSSEVSGGRSYPSIYETSPL